MASLRSGTHSMLVAGQSVTWSNSNDQDTCLAQSRLSNCHTCQSLLSFFFLSFVILSLQLPFSLTSFPPTCVLHQTHSKCSSYLVLKNTPVPNLSGSNQQGSFTLLTNLHLRQGLAGKAHPGSMQHQLKQFTQRLEGPLGRPLPPSQASWCC